MRSSFLLISICLLFAIEAASQTRTTWTDTEQAFNTKVDSAIFSGFPKNINTRASWNFVTIDRGRPDAPGFDTLTAFPRLYFAYYPFDTSKDAPDVFEFYPDVSFFVNPSESFHLDPTRSFEALNIPNITYGIRGNQQFIQDGYKYEGPYTALFLGAFTKNDKIVIPRYDPHKHYLNVQGIFILIVGDYKFADEIISKLDFAVLSRLLAE